MDTGHHQKAQQKKLRTSVWHLLVGVGLFLTLHPLNAAAVQVVTNGDDSGPGSLRDTIAAAAPGDTIAFAIGVTTVTLTSGELVIAKNLTIEGSGTGGVTVQRDAGAADFRIFNIVSGAQVTLRGLSILYGRGANWGGGISSINSSLTVEDCVIAGNQTTASGDHSGGGILSLSINSSATLNVTRSVVVNNVSDQGGGIHNWASGGTASLNVTDSTLDGNIGTIWAGAILSQASAGATTTLVVNGSTISNHTSIGSATPGAAVLTFAGGGNTANSSFINSTISGNPRAGSWCTARLAASSRKCSIM